MLLYFLSFPVRVARALAICTGTQPAVVRSGAGVQTWRRRAISKTRHPLNQKFSTQFLASEMGCLDEQEQMDFFDSSLCIRRWTSSSTREFFQHREWNTSSVETIKKLRQVVDMAFNQCLLCQARMPTPWCSRSAMTMSTAHFNPFCGRSVATRTPCGRINIPAKVLECVT